MDRTSLLPPLLGDGNGNYRIQILGNSGSGKTTLGKELGKILGVQFIALDTLFWEPGWVKTPAESFKAKLLAAFDKAGNSWIVDGNYTRRVGPLVEHAATDVIWLDPPFLLYFPRLCFRTFKRLLRLEPGPSAGCSERFTEVFFSSDSIIWWCITNHRPVRKRGIENMQRDGIHLGGKHRRIGGWGSELRGWKQGVVDMVRETSDD